MRDRLTYNLIIACLFFGLTGFAQVVIPDPNFRQFLLNNYPAVMNGNQTLNPTAAQTINTPFHCENQNVSDLTGIEYFTNITTLEVKHNPNLTSIPNIDALTDLYILGLDSNGLTVLPDLSALVNLEILSVRSNKLTSIPSLAGLSKITIFFVDGNLLASLPDLSAQVNMDKIICSDNPLTSLPSFSTLTKLTFLKCQHTQIAAIPDLNNCPLLEYLICTHNNVTTLPPMNNCTLLKEVKVFDCKLQSLPDFSIFTLLYSLKIQNNALTFEDLLPLASNSFFSSFTLNPQNVGNSIGLTAFATAPYTINLSLDESISTNLYTWYKNGVWYSTSIVPRLVFGAVQFSDAGIYTCIVTNTNSSMVGIEVQVSPISLSVAPCIVSNSIQFSEVQNECNLPIKVELNENCFVGGTKPFTYTVRIRSDTVNFTTNEISVSSEGEYDLIVKDAGGCSVKFPSGLNIQRPEHCDPVFYPNGDGVADLYFIQGNGTARIYNRAGEVVKQVELPAHWDGTNNAGKELPSGLYVIEINKSKSERVTLMR